MRQIQMAYQGRDIGDIRLAAAFIDIGLVGTAQGCMGKIKIIYKGGYIRDIGLVQRRTVGVPRKALTAAGVADLVLVDILLPRVIHVRAVIADITQTVAIGISLVVTA